MADTATVVHIDLYEVRSWADLMPRLSAAMVDVPGPAGVRLGQMAASIDLNLGLLKATFSTPSVKAPDATVDSLVDILVDYARSSPSVVVSDEFSSISRIAGAAGLLRTKLQHHFQTIGLLFAGSEPSTMRMLFEAVDQLFYAQADLLRLPALSLAVFTDIVIAGFDAPPTSLAAKIYAFTGGHPQRSMQLADAAWQVARTEPADPT